jgi:hypothetical protein
MSYLSSNPYLLNIVPLFNVADPSGGIPFNDLTGDIANIETMINTTTYTLSANAIQPYTTGQTITMTGNVNIAGSFEVNGYTFGSDSTGCNITTANQFIVSTGSTTFSVLSTNTINPSSTAAYFQVGQNQVFQLDSLGRILYKGDGLTSNINRFWISSSILSADRAGIGIGPQSTMSTLFDVYKGDAYFDANVNVNSNISCRTLSQFSDERLKKDIYPLRNAISTLHQIRGVHYTMDGEKQIGFLAQELQKVLPEAVNISNPDLLSVDYSRVIPLLVEAIKELDSRIPK